MPKLSNSEAKAARKQWKAYLQDNIITVGGISLSDFKDRSEIWQKFTEDFSSIYLANRSIVADKKKDISYILTMSMALFDRHKLLYIKLQRLVTILKDYDDPYIASHSQKRKLVCTLGLLKPPPSVKSILLHPQPDINIIWRERSSTKPPRYSYLVEIPCDVPKTLEATEQNGFYILPSTQSAIFLSGSEEDYCIELVVLRDIANISDSEDSQQLYKWLEAIVDAACNERRNVRPSHDGIMTQMGLNMGPRNARILGWAVSYVKALAASYMVRQDEEIIGASSFIWSIINSMVPTEISAHVSQYLDAEQLPRIATRNVTEGTGYRLTLGEKTYSFPLQERGPSEIYMSKGYSAWTHTDKSYCDYAFSFCAARTQHFNFSQWQKRILETGDELPDGKLEGGGANFADASLKVLVKQARGTLMVFRPNFHHGTTLACGALNHAITYAFSSRVTDALRKIAVRVEKEAGEGNPYV